ncbi:MAG: RHS repeat domain-containing protein, partial [Bacteroidota bacterium]
GCSHEVPFTINPNPKNPQAELFLEFEDVTFWNTQIAGDWAGGYLAIENAGRREVFRIEGGSSVNPDFHLYLPPGDYFLKATAYMNGEAMSGRLKVQEIVVDTVQGVAVFGEKAGGLRIKEIHTFSDQHVSALKKRFSYTHTVDGISYSSGTLGAEPRYHYTFQESAVDPTIGGGNTSGSGVGGTPATINSCNYAGEFFNPCYYFVTNSSPLNLQGGVQYHTVTEEQLDAQDQPNGKTVSQFTSFIDQPNRGYYYMFPTNFTSYDWRRGLPITQKVYDQHGVLLRESNTTHLFSADSTNGYAFGMGLPNVHASRGIVAKLKFDSGCTYQPYTCEAEDVLDYSNFAGLVVRQVGSGIFENERIVELSDSLFLAIYGSNSFNVSQQIAKKIAAVEKVILDAGIITYTRPQKPTHMTDQEFYNTSFRIKSSTIKIDSIFGIKINLPIGAINHIQLTPYNEIDLCNGRPLGHVIVPEPRTKYYYHQYDLISEWVYPHKQTETVYENGEVLNTTIDYYYDNPTHAQLTRTVTQNSDDRITVRKFKYPLDYLHTLSVGSGGLSMETLTEKHMIGSVLEQQLWEGSDPNNLSLLQASVQTFADASTLANPPLDQIIVRPQQMYLLETNTGLAPGFESTQGQPPVYNELIPHTDYKARAAYEFYGESGLLKNETLNSGQKVSYLWNDLSRLPTAQCRNASADQMAYTSFETPQSGSVNGIDLTADGGWEIVRQAAAGWVNSDPSQVQTGIYGFHLAYRGGNSERYIRKTGLAPGDYKVSFWYEGDPIDVVSSAPVSSQSAPSHSGSEMRYISYVVNVGLGGSIEISCAANAFIDELRLYPVDAQLTTYCYDEALRLHTQTDQNNRSTYYHYDELGRLQYIKDQNGNYVQGYEYSYKN